MSEIGWLHLTDLHIGHSSSQSLLSNVKAELFEDLSWLHEQSGPWDLLFFTGDLTNKGLPKEFTLFDEFLSELFAHLALLGSKPLLLPVPGNHDLVRPSSDDSRVAALKNWDREQSVRTDFWRNGSQYQKLIESAFTNYVAWSRNLPARNNSEWKDGVLPGDFRLRIGDLGIVGLNSAAIHLSNEFRSGTLVLGVEQLQALFPNPPHWLAKNSANVLLSHHPPEWLTRSTRKLFETEVAPAGRFDFHLFGHLHEHSLRWTRIGGGAVTRRFQGASLFGVTSPLKKWKRIHGYSAARLTLLGEEMRIEIWPRRALLLQNGKRMMILDPTFELDRSTQSFRDPSTTLSRRASSIASPNLVLDGFAAERLEQRIMQSRKIRMLIMRSRRWFAKRQNWLVQRIKDGTLELEVLLPEPSNANLMEQLRSMYEGLSTAELSRSIQAVIGRLFEMRSLLPPDRKGALRIATHEYYPPYSAYLFDDEELWYIPYHRKPATLPVFVYRERLERLAVYADFLALNVWWQTGAEWKQRLTSQIRNKLDHLRSEYPLFDKHLKRLTQSNTKVVVFGGFVRDCIHSFVHGQALDLCDMDIVVEGSIGVASGGSPNHFGATRWQLGSGLYFDCWELASTVAFQRALVTPTTLANLTRTTIYRLDGCYFDLDDEALHADEAIADIFSRRVVFNCKGYLDMHPEYQAFRAVDLANRLDYALEEDVIEFVSRTLRTAGRKRFAKLVREHRPNFDASSLRDCFDRYAIAPSERMQSKRKFEMETNAIGWKSSSSLSALDDELLQIARQPGRLTLTAAVAITKANRNTLKLHLRQLVQGGRLQLFGRGRSVWYEVVSED